MPMAGTELAGPLLLAFALFCVILVTITALAPQRLLPHGLEQAVYLGAGLGCFCLSAALLAQASAHLGGGTSPRVSPALGFWGLPTAAYILINHSKILRGRGRLLLTVVLLLLAALILGGGRGKMISVWREFTVLRERFLTESLVHLRLFSIAVLLAALIGIPLGMLAASRRRLAGPLIAFVDGAYTIPSMALFGLLMAPLSALSRAIPVLRSMGIKGVGAAPALTALTLYAMLPIVRNTIAGLNGVPRAVVDVGRGMGMPGKQLFFRVRWPMALPYVLAGLRTASVQAVGNTAVAALIGAGGLGIMIFQGLGQAAPDLILLGVIPLIILAAAVDRTWGWLTNIWVSPGLMMKSGQYETRMESSK